MPGPLLAPHPAAFPVHPPTDLGDPEAIISNDWAAFASLKHTKNHWDRPGWTDQTRLLYWLLTFDEPSLLEAVLDHQERLRSLGLDQIRPGDLHLTLARVGDRQSLSPQQLRELVRTATDHVGAAFSLEFHPLTGSPGAVRYSVTPWTDLVALHNTLTQVHRHLCLPGGKPTTRYRPHLGLGYQSCAREAGPVIDAVGRLRLQPPIPLTVRHVDLVELRRDPGRYTWDRLARVPLDDRHQLN